MRIHTDVDSIRGFIQDVSIEEKEEVRKQRAEAQKEPEDVVEISRENMAASAVRVKDAEAAMALLGRIRIQIQSEPMAALLAQANIVGSNVTGLVG